MQPRKLFVAGATGATGRVLVPMAERWGLAVVPHVRPGRAHNHYPNAAVIELADRKATSEAMRGCTTVIQLIGTMRKRFASGDTYETSDIGTTRQLCEAAADAGVDHFILLSSVGAGRPFGAYLRAKAAAEDIVRQSGLAWTIVRPSALMGGERRPPPGFLGLTRALGLKRLEPIGLEQLSSALLRCAKERAPLSVALEGQSLWALVDVGW